MNIRGGWFPTIASGLFMAPLKISYIRIEMWGPQAEIAEPIFCGDLRNAIRIAGEGGEFAGDECLPDMWGPLS